MENGCDIDVTQLKRYDLTFTISKVQRLSQAEGVNLLAYPELHLFTFIGDKSAFVTRYI